MQANNLKILRDSRLLSLASRVTKRKAKVMKKVLMKVNNGKIKSKSRQSRDGATKRGKYLEEGSYFD